MNWRKMDLKIWVLFFINTKEKTCIVLAVVGNKIDLIGQEKVSIETGEKFSKVEWLNRKIILLKNLGAIFKTCSAKNDKGINVIIFIKYWSS